MHKKQNTSYKNLKILINYFRLDAKNAPTLAKITPGINNIQDRINPNGQRLPKPCERIIPANCPKKGKSPQRQARGGSIYPNINEMTYITGKNICIYSDESQASHFPDNSDITIQPITPLLVDKVPMIKLFFISYLSLINIRLKIHRTYILTEQHLSFRTDEIKKRRH